MQHLNSGNRETAAFIGFGITGVSEFCSYVKAAIQNNQQSHIIIFEKNKKQFATGEPFSLDTTPLWLLNGPPAEGFQIPANEMSLYDWIMQHHQHCHDTYGEFEDRYPPRALIGEYLISRYEKYRDLALAHGITIDIRYEAVTHLDVTSEKKFQLNADSGMVTADFVGLGLGTLGPDHFQEMKDKPGFIDHPWNEHELDNIPSDAKDIIVIGGHLTFVDTAKYLLLARHYQGNFTVATRYPNMLTTRDFKHTVAKEPMLQLQKTFNEHKTDKLSLKSALTLFEQTYRASARHPVDDKQNTHYALKTQVAAHDHAETTFFPHGDIDELCDFVGLFADSGTYADMWKVLTPEAQEEFAKHYFGRVLSYLAGVPLINSRFLKEWYDSGRVEEKSGMTSLSYDSEKKEFICRFNDGSEKRAQYVVNATGMGHDIKRHLTEQPLLADLLQKGTISVKDFGGIIVDEHNQVVSSENKQIDNLVAVGPGVYKGLPSGEASYFISAKAENGVQEHFRQMSRRP